MILLDAYRGPFVPFHLTTQQFYQLVKNHLVEKGGVAQNVEPTTLLFDSTLKTMKSVFDQVDVLPADGNLVLIGYSGKRLSDSELARRAASAQERYRFKYDLRVLVEARIDSEAPGPDAKILTDDFAPVEYLNVIKRKSGSPPISDPLHLEWTEDSKTGLPSWLVYRGKPGLRPDER